MAFIPSGVKKTSSNTEETVYNHNTGYRKNPGAIQTSTLNTPMTFRLPLFRGLFYVHPGKFPSSELIVYIYIRLTFTHNQVRNDLLTIREMARIFGFPDDFVFYDGPLNSYRYFADAVPPPIAAIVARGIRQIIDQLGWAMGEPLPMGGVSPTSGGNKRPRLD